MPLQVSEAVQAKALTMHEPTTIYLALGSNLGDRAQHLRAALAALAPSVTVEGVSSLYETAPAYVTDQPPFYNAVVRGTTVLQPLALLAELKRIETVVGRRPGLRYGPRVIDLDILLYGNLIVQTPELSIPHARLAERPFVLVPLAELAPNLIPPGQIATVATLAAQAHGTGDVLARVGAV